MSLKDSRIAAVAAVSDMDRARRFYEEQLGLEEADGTESSELQRLYGCGEHTGLMVYVSPEHAGHSTATLGAWRVEDLDSEMESLRSRGIEFERYDQPGLQTDENGVVSMGDVHACWFRDPDGNTFAVADG